MDEVRCSASLRSIGWVKTTYESTLGYATFLTAEFGMTYWKYTATTPERTDYDIQLRDEAGLLLWEFKDIEEATLDQIVNNPATVSLVCPLNAQIEQILPDLERPNSIWVWKNGELVFTGPFLISEVTHGETKSIDINAQDYMVQLKSELVEFYDETADADAHVTAFLAFQESSMQVMVGTIEPATSLSITIERDYIYNVLMNLRDTLGGYMYVDPDKKLNWLWSIAPATITKQIRYKKDLVSIKKHVDWVNFGNRLYIYGDGCNLIDAGYATEYIEDTASIDAYGLCVRRLYVPSFSSASAMLRYAEIKIAEMSQPRITYEVEIVNLADFGWSADEITLGMWVRVIDEEIGIELDAQVVRVVYDMVHGEKVEIEIAAKGIDICDIIPSEYVL